MKTTFIRSNLQPVYLNQNGSLSYMVPILKLNTNNGLLEVRESTFTITW